MIKFFLVACVVIVSAQEGILLVKRGLSTPSGYFGQSENITITIEIYNVGTGPAYTVSVEDPWPEDQFKLLEGSKSKTWQEIAPGMHETMNLTVIPNQNGPFPVHKAEISYQPQMEGHHVTGSSTGHPPFLILSREEFEKKTAKHYDSWAFFILGFSASVLVPFYLWFDIQMKYSHGIPKECITKKSN